MPELENDGENTIEVNRDALAGDKTAEPTDPPPPPPPPSCPWAEPLAPWRGVLAAVAVAGVAALVLRGR